MKFTEHPLYEKMVFKEIRFIPNRTFHGVEIPYIHIAGVEPNTFDYVGQDTDTQGEVWDIVKDIETGGIYYTDFTKQEIKDKE